MPELPEVETTRAGLSPYLLSQKILSVKIRQPQLRWRIPEQIDSLRGQSILEFKRRGKYLILSTHAGHALIHLGMSGSLRIACATEAPSKHDHWDLGLNQNRVLRYRDPRRFGALLWTTKPPEQHKLLARMGPEPLQATFNGFHLHQSAQGKRREIKSFIMDSQVVVGVGNIYASEALFRAGIHPQRSVNRIGRAKYELLAQAIVAVLQQAISAGGTSLRDFYQADGQPGYFRQQLKVYGRENLPCFDCGTLIRKKILAQRSSFYCAHCQH
jgi:formamidopyrimidine-DNA glycosylase